MINDLYSMYQMAQTDQNREALFSAVWRLAIQRLRDEDAAQNATLRVFEKMHQFAPTGKFESWVRAVIIRCGKTDIRRYARFRHGPLPDHEDYHPPDPEQLADIARIPIEELPETEQRICLAILDGDSITEAGARLGLSRDATRKRLRKVKKYCRN